MTTSAVKLVCRTCGQPINDPSHVTWYGHHYHNNHVTLREPPPVQLGHVAAERERCAAIADNELAFLRQLKADRIAEGDHDGAKRASIGATIAARIANSIRNNCLHNIGTPHDRP